MTYTSPSQRLVIQCLTHAQMPLATVEIVIATGLSSGVLVRLLPQLAKAGVIARLPGYRASWSMPIAAEQTHA